MSRNEALRQMQMQNKNLPQFQPRSLNTVPTPSQIKSSVHTPQGLALVVPLQLNVLIEPALPNMPIEHLRRLYDLVVSEIARRDEKL